MFKRRWLILGIVTLSIPLGPALALELGDPAPAITVDWLRGGPIDLKAGKGKSKNVYVLEFWATWCGPCRISLPHLSELQHKYKDKGLVVIGVALGDEPVSVIKKYLADSGKKIDFPIAVDRNGATVRAYMMPFGAEGIPWSCVIDKDGRLAWVGSPFAGLDKIIEQCVAGTYNLKARLALNKYFETAVQADRATKSEDQKELRDKVRKIGEELLKTAVKTPEVLDLLAWNIVTLPLLKTRDLDLARQACKIASEATKDSDPSLLDTYARVLWESGDKNGAMRMQKKAIELVKDEQLAAILKEHLKEFEEDLKKNPPPASSPASQAAV
ncbi:MAG TPA: redoxin family protein [Phycisphaerae bacterium]|nr:redoxin family protein [Phycisphaerae bacterium]